MEDRGCTLESSTGREAIVSNLVVRKFDESGKKAASTGIEFDFPSGTSDLLSDVGLLGDKVTLLREATKKTLKDLSEADEAFRKDLAVYFEYLIEEMSSAMSLQAVEAYHSSKRENLLIQSIVVTTYGTP